MSGSKPKEAAPKSKAASTKKAAAAESKAAPPDSAAKATPEAAVQSGAKEKAVEKADFAKEERSPAQRKAAVDGVELARQRRLARAGVGGALCDLLGVPLDVGPRSNPWLRPTTIGDDILSELGAVILASGISPEALERAAARLRKRGPS